VAYERLGRFQQALDDLARVKGAESESLQTRLRHQLASTKGPLLPYFPNINDKNSWRTTANVSSWEIEMGSCRPSPFQAVAFVFVLMFRLPILFYFPPGGKQVAKKTQCVAGNKGGWKNPSCAILFPFSFIPSFVPHFFCFFCFFCFFPFFFSSFPHPNTKKECTRLRPRPRAGFQRKHTRFAAFTTTRGTNKIINIITHLDACFIFFIGSAHHNHVLFACIETLSFIGYIYELQPPKIYLFWRFRAHYILPFLSTHV
jgi:hypothetical protein